MPALMDAALAYGVATNIYIGFGHVSAVLSYVGDVVRARRCFDEMLVAAASEAEANAPTVAIARASLQLAEGQDPEAAATLADAVDRHGVDRGLDRRPWRQALALSYLLVPETRKYWDGQQLRGLNTTARELAATLVGLREDGDTTRLHRLDLPDTGVVRAALHHRHVVELAVGLNAAGRPEGRALLEAVGPAGRAALRALAEQPRLGKEAKALLAASPAPPPHVTHLDVLGPLVLRRGGNEVVDPDLRRQRVQELLAFLVSHRQTTRDAISAALWPDLDEAAAANNLSVTLSRLLRLLEPWRAAGEPTYLVRVDGPHVRLVADEHLVIDADEFERHLRAAADAEDHDAPSLALDHHLAAVALYRDHLYAGLPGSDWAELDREHYRVRFVASATRAGQLLVAQGDAGQAETVAQRVLASDPWSEPAHAVLVGAALLRDDQSAARRTLTRCLTMLADLDVDPSPATRQLQRRVLGT
jgi:DNA-binding SARP family transcriptional activator